MDDLTITALTVSFIVLLLTIFRHSFSPKNSTPLPPGPRGLPLVGYLPFLRESSHHQFTQLAHKYGPIYKLQLGSKLAVVISSPPLIKEVVRDNDAVFASRDPPVAAMVATNGQDIFWAGNGPYWRDMRKLFVREMMSSASLQASYSLRRDEVVELVGTLNANIGKPVEIGELIFLTELKVILRLLWGGAMDNAADRETLGAEFREKVTKYMDLLGKPNVSDFFPVLARFNVQGIEKEMRVVLAGVEEILDSVIDQRLKMKGDCEGEERRANDFLGILLGLMGEEVGERKSFGQTQLKAMLLDIVVGGTDTTATVVEWVMAELLKNPDVMQNVQQEITEVVGSGNNVEESHISKLQYLEAVVKETFRLHPPLSIALRFLPTQSCTVGGYTIPQGSRVFLNMWSVYMDPQIWDNPSEFRPDRFLSDSGKKFDYMGKRCEFLPFGSGRRVCPGLPLAERMVMYLLATLVHLFEWRLAEGKTLDMSEKFEVIIRKTTSLVAIPCRRLPLYF